jgi:hypothetical protein
MDVLTGIIVIILVSIICGVVKEAVRDIIRAVTGKNHKVESTVYQMRFSDYQASLIKDLIKTFGTQIAYRHRNGIIVDNIPAIPATSDMLVEQTAAKTFIKSTCRNYIIRLSLLNTKPEIGDRIIDGDSEYDVTNNENRQCYRPIDPDSMMIRIYVKKVK